MTIDSRDLLGSLGDLLLLLGGAQDLPMVLASLGDLLDSSSDSRDLLGSPWLYSWCRQTPQPEGRRET